MFQERNQRSGDRSNLIRCNVHQIDILDLFNREVSVFTGFSPFVHKVTFVVDLRIRLSDYQSFFFLCR